MRELKRATNKLSFTEEAQASAAAVVTSVAALQAATAKGSAREAKQSFVSAVGALRQWAAAADIDTVVKGL